MTITEQYTPERRMTGNAILTCANKSTVKKHKDLFTWNVL